MLRLNTTLSFCTTLLLAFSSLLSIATHVHAVTQTSKIIISEIKLGGPVSGSGHPKEFVSLYNQSEDAIDLDGWSLEYAKAGFDKAHCGSPYWSEYDQAVQVLLNGSLSPQSVASFEMSLTDTSDGSLRLLEETSDTLTQHDLVGWGEGAPCAESEPADKPTTTTSSPESLHRYLDCDARAPIDTDDNAKDFELASDVSYGELGGQPAPDCAPDDRTVSDCDGVVITEVLPNPAGADADSEFIELYNPTVSYKSLKGCGAQVSSSSRIYRFNQSFGLNPGEYTALYSDDSGLTLPNANGGTVYLLSADDEELDEVNYESDLDDDVSWSWFGGNIWQATYAPTPGTTNKLQSAKSCPPGQSRSASSGRCVSTGRLSSDLVPCRPGQARNPATNRCRSILSASNQLKPCRSDQRRNPATNRCRSILSASAALKPCKAGQFRNPATNRCKKLESATSDLKPCQPGQARNPMTNRCRRVEELSGASTPNPLGVAGAIPASPLSTGLVATTAGLALVYGAYEFRHGIRNKFEIIRRYFTDRWHSGP